MRSAKLLCALAALLVAAVVAPGAGASPESDSAAVIKDYQGDRDIGSCRFTQGQLERARALIAPDVDAYAPAYRIEVNTEIKRWKDGGCAGTKRVPGVDLRIVEVQPKGAAKAESVTLKNFGSKAVNLRRYGLRDASDHTIRFKKTTLEARRSLRVVTGCRKGRKGAVRKGSRYYACRTTAFWDDAGDVVELVSPSGGLLSQKKYGTAAT